MVQKLITICIAFMFVVSMSSAEGHSPVCCHISFDNLKFLEDCYVHRSGLKTPQERKLELVNGRFGNALYLGAVPLLYDDDNLSGIDLDLVTAVIYNVAMAQLKGTVMTSRLSGVRESYIPPTAVLRFGLKGRCDQICCLSRHRLLSEDLKKNCWKYGSWKTVPSGLLWKMHNMHAIPLTPDLYGKPIHGCMLF